jgi:Protein of unknown function (DUF3363)
MPRDRERQFPWRAQDDVWRPRRPADRNIAIVASGTGVYRPSAHRKMLGAASAGVRVGDYEAFVDTHVRRSEALRRAAMSSGPAPIVGSFPENFEVRATAYDASPSFSTRLLILEF